jgi:hypothetical protein
MVWEDHPMSKMRAAVLIALALGLVANMAFAGTAPVSTARCIAAGSQARVDWNAGSSPRPAAVRVYFQSANAKMEHYVEMRSAGNGSYWAVLPKPQAGVSYIDYRVATVEGANDLTRDHGRIALANDCASPRLGSQEASYASSLIVGSAEPVSPVIPVGFKCDGIIGRINAKGELSAFDACGEQALMVASVQKRQQRSVDTVASNMRETMNPAATSAAASTPAAVGHVASAAAKVRPEVIITQNLAPEELLKQIEQEEENKLKENADDPKGPPPLEVSPSRP